MIRDREHATAVAKVGEELISELFRVAELRPDGTYAATSEEARRHIVQLIGKIDTELLWPIYRQYPDLEPERLRKKRRHEP